MSDNTQALRAGSRLQGGRYTIEKTLGFGGFGITYLAVQAGLDRHVAVKEFFMRQYCGRDATTSAVTVGSNGLRDIVSTARGKFVKEARTIAALDNNHIIRIYDIFEENGTAYYVMEYISGGSLADLVKRRGVLPEEEAAGYARQIADALGYIHGKNILHLDIKPSNLLFRKDGEMVLIDFGVSKHYDEEGVETTESPVARSRGYAPIEQYQAGGIKQFAPSTDIYSLGAVLYFMLVGKRPPEATMLISGKLTYPDHVSLAMRAVIDKAMAPDRGGRYQSAIDFKRALGIPKNDIEDGEETEIDNGNDATEMDAVPAATVGTPRQSQLEPKPEPGKKGNGTRKIAIMAAAVVLTALLLYGITSTKSGQPASAEGDEYAPDGIINGHEYVDLGLSVKWATCNVGASSPEEYGDYYAWGETETKPLYDEGNSETYNEDILNIENTKRDVAHVKWRGTWRMPTRAEMKKLLSHCTWTWTTLNSVNGYKVTGKNGKSIFIPAAGSWEGLSPSSVGSSGRYWSSEAFRTSVIGYGIPTGCAYSLEFSISEHRISNDGCYAGLLVRPVVIE